MEMVAQRVAGYTMPTQEQCDLVSLEGLHAYFRAHKGQAMVTEESEFGATKARGKGTVGQAAVNEVKRRKARFDELGQGRQSKMATLSQLLARSHVWANPDPTAPEEEEWLGLSAVVTALQKPVLMVRAPWDKRGGAPHLILVKKVHNTPDAVITAEKAALRRKAVAASKAEAAAKVEAEAAATNAEAAAAAVDDGSDSDAEMMAELRAEATPAPEVKDEAEAPLPLAPVVPLAPAPAAEDDSPVSDEDIPEAFGLDEDEESIWEDVVTSPRTPKKMRSGAWRRWRRRRRRRRRWRLPRRGAFRSSESPSRVRSRRPGTWRSCARRSFTRTTQRVTPSFAGGKGRARSGALRRRRG